LQIACYHEFCKLLEAIIFRNFANCCFLTGFLHKPGSTPLAAAPWMRLALTKISTTGGIWL